MKNKTKNIGFTILELAIVVVIIGVLTGVIVYNLRSSYKAVQVSDTRDRIAEIKKSLYRFYYANGRLPCPAQGTSVAGDSTFGIEINSSACDVVAGGSNVVPNGTLRFLGSDGTTYVRLGTLPTSALGISDSMMLDAYGNRFTYMVSERFTTSAVDGVITINDGVVPTTVSSVAGFAIISHGDDGKGAYKQNGSQITCGSSGRDIENCDGDYVVTDAQYNDLVTVGATKWFDDIVGWAIKSEITSQAPPTTSTTTSCDYEFILDSKTFVRPSGITSFRVLAIGGGGGGGGGKDDGGGGGGSGYVDVETVTLNSDPAITIGTGGAGGSRNTDGSNGVATSFTASPSNISASYGRYGGRGNGSAGAGGAGGVAGRNGGSGGSSGTPQASFTITKGGTIVNDGTDTVTFTCAKFMMPTSYANTTSGSGGNGGNGIYSPQAPLYGNKAGGAGGTGGDVYGTSGAFGGGGGGSANGSGSTLPNGGKGGGGGDGGSGNNKTYSAGGGGGGYGGAGGGGSGGTSTTYCGGGGGGYGGGTGGGYAGLTYALGGGAGGGGGGYIGGLGIWSAGGGGSGCTLGGKGGSGFGAGGGGGNGNGSDFSGGGGGGSNGMVYIEWDQ